MRILAAFLLLVTVVAPLSAQRGGTANTLARDPDAPPVPASLDDVAWLAGHWRGDGPNGVSEEIWSGPEAGSMVGVYRLMNRGAVVLYEIMTIVPVGESLEMRIKHFNADLTGWEEREEVERFPLVRISATAAHFDGLTVRRAGDDAMEAFVAVQGRDGAIQEEAFRYARVTSH